VAGGIPALKNKTLGDILAKWNKDLEDQTKEFHRMANLVSKWDRNIMENGYRIQDLYNQVTSCEAQQKEIDANFEYIASQQTELTNLLDTYEASLKSLPDSEIQNPVDQERDKAFSLAETVAQNLDQMGDLLKNMIEEMNSRKGVKEETQVEKIVKIMNNHYTCLKTLDEEAAELEKKLEGAKKTQLTARIQGERIYGGRI
jgi:nuclear pore complex protein Nup62